MERHVKPMLLMVIMVLGFMIAPLYVVFADSGYIQKKGVRVTALAKTKNGWIQGRKVGALHVYRGIPYAAPPVGNLRFKPPAPVSSWSGVLDATQYGPSPAQPASPYGGVGNHDEDCLYVNVATPAVKQNEKLPVLVTFHGGGLIVGTIDSPIYNALGLPSHGLVRVGVNARLGVLGYMALAELSQESPHNVSGNYGTLDLIAALKWVKENIKYFGGDPKNVTVCGESGGGTKIFSIMGSPLAKGLFHRAIISSGGGTGGQEFTNPISLAEAEVYGRVVLGNLGITATGPDALTQLRQKTWQQVVAAGGPYGGLGYQTRLIVDGWVLPDSLKNIFESGKQAAVPVIIGANSAETVHYDFNTAFATYMLNVGMNTYLNVFSYLPSNWRGADGVLGVPHGFDLYYFYGNLEGVPLFASNGSWGMVAAYNRDPNCSPNPGPNLTNAATQYAVLTEEDMYTVENMETIFAQFAKTGAPSVHGLIEWPAYDSSNPEYFDIGVQLQIRPWSEDAFNCNQYQ